MLLGLHGVTATAKLVAIPSLFARFAAVAQLHRCPSGEQVLNVAVEAQDLAVVLEEIVAREEVRCGVPITTANRWVRKGTERTQRAR